MRDVVTRWKHFLSPDSLNPDFHDFPPALVFPDATDNLLIPGFAHLPASVEALNVLETDHQHDVTKQEVRHRIPASNKHIGHKHKHYQDLHYAAALPLEFELNNHTENYYQDRSMSNVVTSHWEIGSAGSPKKMTLVLEDHSTHNFGLNSGSGVS